MAGLCAAILTEHPVLGDTSLPACPSTVPVLRQPPVMAPSGGNGPHLGSCLVGRAQALFYLTHVLTTRPPSTAVPRMHAVPLVECPGQGSSSGEGTAQTGRRSPSALCLAAPPPGRRMGHPPRPLQLPTVTSRLQGLCGERTRLCSAAGLMLGAGWWRARAPWTKVTRQGSGSRGPTVTVSGPWPLGAALG